MRHLVVSVAFWALLAGAATAKEISLERPGDRQFVMDNAGLLDAAVASEIRGLADQLLTDRATPILVVTIESMAAHGGAGMAIEEFARTLFDQWGIGYAKLGKQDWNTGILLLVSKLDRKARIELGAGWSRDKDALALKIMDQNIIPNFKRGDFSSGILAGVQSLDAMAREKELPRASRPASHYWMIAGFLGLALFTAVSLIRRGSSGWAWVLWGVVFGLLGTLLYHALSNRGSGGGFSGGSFGGGSSGGGGATGSW